MNRKNKDLRVVRDSEDVDKLVRRIMDNTEDEETQMAQLEEPVSYTHLTLPTTPYV